MDILFDTYYRLIAEAMVKRGYSATTRMNIMLDYHARTVGQSWMAKIAILQRMIDVLKGPVHSLLDIDCNVS